MTESTIIKELSEDRKVVFYTVGVSMRPLLRERQTHVVLGPIDTPKNKDIILYQRANGNLVLHRLMKQTEQAYFMRGDNTFGLERIDKSKAFGVVEGIYRKGKYIDVNNSKRYKAYVAFWHIIYPVRFLWVRLKNLTRKLLRKKP